MRKFFRELTVGKPHEAIPDIGHLNLIEATLATPGSEEVNLLMMIDGTSLEIGTFSRSYRVYSLPLRMRFMPDSEVEFLIEGDESAKVHLKGYYEGGAQEDCTGESEALKKIKSVVTRKVVNFEVNRKLLNALNAVRRFEAQAVARPPRTPAALAQHMLSSIAPLWAYATTCNICLEPFEEGELLRTLHCGHIFHAKCTDQWLKKSSTCALCRQAIF